MDENQIFDSNSSPIIQVYARLNCYNCSGRNFAIFRKLRKSRILMDIQSYTVAQQTPEIGVRVAIGASKGQILKRVVFQAMRPAMVGVVVGLGGALALSRLMTSLLFQVEASDPATYAGVAGVLVVAAVLSALLPAMRATRVDPVIAFRAE